MRDRPSRPGPRKRARPASAGPASARPAAARRTGSGGPGTTTRISANHAPGRFTGRAVVLGVVLVALALSYVFPLRVYLGQQADIAELRAEQAEKRARVDQLAAEAARWSDDDYIRIQARKRLYFGEPEETLLIVLPGEEPEPPATGFDPDDVPEPPTVWWDTLWASIQTADQAGVRRGVGEAPAEDDPGGGEGAGAGR